MCDGFLSKYSKMIQALLSLGWCIISLKFLKNVTKYIEPSEDYNTAKVKKKSEALQWDKKRDTKTEVLNR